VTGQFDASLEQALGRDWHLNRRWRRRSSSSTPSRRGGLMMIAKERGLPFLMLAAQYHSTIGTHLAPGSR
jgi:hypothetical protein